MAKSNGGSAPTTDLLAAHGLLARHTGSPNDVKRTLERLAEDYDNRS